MILLHVKASLFGIKNQSQNHLLPKHVPGATFSLFYFDFMRKQPIWGLLQNPMVPKWHPKSTKWHQKARTFHPGRSPFLRSRKRQNIENRAVDWTFVLFMFFVILHSPILAVQLSNNT